MSPRSRVRVPAARMAVGDPMMVTPEPMMGGGLIQGEGLLDLIGEFNLGGDGSGDGLGTGSDVDANAGAVTCGDDGVGVRHLIGGRGDGDSYPAGHLG